MLSKTKRSRTAESPPRTQKSRRQSSGIRRQRKRLQSSENLTVEPYASILCYPKPSEAELQNRLQELKNHGVKAVEFAGNANAFKARKTLRLNPTRLSYAIQNQAKPNCRIASKNSKITASKQWNSQATQTPSKLGKPYG